MTFTILMIIGSLTIAGVLGLVGAELAEDGGPKRYLLGGFIGSATAAIFGFFLLTVTTNPTSILVPLHIAVGMLVPIASVNKKAVNARGECERAPIIARTGIKLFDTLDTDNNGILCAGDLRNAVIIEENDIGAVAYMQQHLSNIGHVIGSRRELVVELGAPPDRPGSKTFVTINTYGISKDDLQTFPERVRERYKNWL